MLNLPKWPSLLEHGELSGDIGWLFSVSHTAINDEVPPWYALLRGVVGTVATKLDIFPDMPKFSPNNLLKLAYYCIFAITSPLRMKDFFFMKKMYKPHG